MAEAASQMPADPLGARVYMRHVLEEACLRLLRRLAEDDPPDEKDGVKESAEEVSRLTYGGGAALNLEAVTEKLSAMCGSDLLPPKILEVHAQSLLGTLQALQKCQRINYGNPPSCKPHIQALKSAILRQEKVDAFFAQERGLDYSLYLEIRAVLGKEHWGRIRLGVWYGAQLGAAEGLSCESGANPELQAPPTGGSHAGPEVNGSAANIAPEVKTSAANAAPELQHVDLAIGDRKAGVGYYIEVKKNPKNEQTVVQRNKTLRAILSAENASAPGSLTTREENRVCYQIIFYSPEKLAETSERPEQMEKFLSKHSNWRQTIDCNQGTQGLPKREIGVCIIEVKPDY